MRLLNELHNLLEKLLQLAQEGNSTNEQFGTLADRAGSLVEDIERKGILDLTEFQGRRDALRALYEKLCLIVSAQKATTSGELSRIRRGKKTIETYRNNI